MDKDGLTVVIPTYNRKDLLACTLDSLYQQGPYHSRFEVIVVDDGSSDGTESLALDYSNRLDLRYCFQPDKGFRVAAARNMGIRHARFRAILFIDAGIVVSSRLLGLHYQHQGSTSSLALIGTSYGVLEYSTSCATLINQALEHGIDRALEQLSREEKAFDCRAQYLKQIDYDLSRMSAPWLICWGGHVSVSTDLLRRIEGFDEWFTRWGGEDNELGIRLYQAGCPFRVLREVESIHLPHAKNPWQKRTDSCLNTRYIHQKHGLAETALLMNHNWECIVTGAYASGNTCPCVGLALEEELAS